MKIPSNNLWCFQESREKGDERCYVPKRYVFVLLGFIGIFCMYGMRVNLSVAMVAMVNSSTVHSSGSNIKNSTEFTYQNQTVPEKENTAGKNFDWDAKTQGLIFSSFYYGFTLTHLPGGVFSEKFGGKWLFGGSIFISAILNVLTPITASCGTALLIALRITEGLAQGVALPAMYTMISRWCHKLERSRSSTIMYTGSYIGNIVSMALSGLLSSTNVLGGWPSAFYLFGAVGCTWFLFWAILVYNTPTDHPKISKKELEYLTESEETHSENLIVPWREIFTSLPMWALIIAELGNEFAFNIFVLELPTYLSTVLHFDIKNNGLLSALPFIIEVICAWLISYIADVLRKYNILNINNIRKMCSFIGLTGPALCLLGVTLSSCCQNRIIGLIVLSRALNGFVYPGQKVTPLDMNPNLAGTLFGIVSTINSLTGIAVPFIVGAFMANVDRVTGWNYIFYLTALLLIIAGLFFVAFSSAELQSWGNSGLIKDGKINDGDKSSLQNSNIASIEDISRNLILIT